MFGLPEEIRTSVDKYKAHFHKILKGSLKLKNEEVLIISDHGNDKNTLSSMLGYGYYIGAKDKNRNVTLLFQEVKKGFMFADDHVVKAMQQLPEGSIVIVAVSNKLGRFGEENSFRHFCREKNHRFLSATGLGDVQINHFNLFMDAMGIGYKRMKKRGNVIKKAWDKAKEIRVKTEAGTDLRFNVEGMQAIVNIGEYHSPGMGGNMPAGEVYIPPKGMDGVEGILIIDGSLKTENGAILIDEPVKLTIEKGKVVNVEGKYAHLLQQTFQKFEDRAKYPERVRQVCELGIGINPGAVLIGSMIMDEKVMGTGHVAMGSNYWFGGEIKTVYHGDQVFKSPIFYVDGEKMEF